MSVSRDLARIRRTALILGAGAALVVGGGHAGADTDTSTSEQSTSTTTSTTSSTTTTVPTTTTSATTESTPTTTSTPATSTTSTTSGVTTTTTATTTGAPTETVTTTTPIRASNPPTTTTGTTTPSGKDYVLPKTVNEGPTKAPYTPKPTKTGSTPPTTTTQPPTQQAPTQQSPIVQRAMEFGTQLLLRIFDAFGYKPGVPSTSPLAPVFQQIWWGWQQITRRADNSRPTVNPTVTGYDPTTGVASGKINGYDADGDVLQYSATGMRRGTVVIDQKTGSFVYTPDTAYAHSLSLGGRTTTGSDTITFTATDDIPVNGTHTHASGSAADSSRSVGVTITPMNAPPTATVSVTKNSDGTSTIVVRTTDPDGDTVSVTPLPNEKAVGRISRSGDGWTYTPDAAVAHSLAMGGTSSTPKRDTVIFRVDDQHGAAFPVVGYATVDPANKVPTLVVGDPVRTGATTTWTLTAADGDGDTLTTSVNPPSHGTLQLSSTSVTYIPDPDYVARLRDTGTDSFGLTVSDRYGGSTSVTLRPTIPAPPPPAQNRPPVSLGSTSDDTFLQPLETQAVGTRPSSIAVTSDSRYVITTSPQDGTITVIDTQTPGSTRTIAIGRAPTYVVAPTANPDIVVVGDSGAGSVYVLNTSDWSTRSTYTPSSVGGRSVSIAAIGVDSAGEVLFVADSSGMALSAYDIANRRRLWSTPLSDPPKSVVVSGSGRDTDVLVAFRQPSSASFRLVDVNGTTGRINRTIDHDGLLGSITGNDTSFYVVYSTPQTSTNTFLGTLPAKNSTSTALANTVIDRMTEVVMSGDGYALYGIEGGGTIRVLTVDGDRESSDVLPGRIGAIATSTYGDAVYYTDPQAGTLTSVCGYGCVSGRVQVTDPDLDTLTYAITTPPKRGRAYLDARTGTYTYVFIRFGEPDSFTVTTSDGRGGSVDTVVTINLDQQEL